MLCATKEADRSEEDPAKVPGSKGLPAGNTLFHYFHPDLLAASFIVAAKRYAQAAYDLL